MSRAVVRSQNLCDTAGCRQYALLSSIYCRKCAIKPANRCVDPSGAVIDLYEHDVYAIRQGQFIKFGITSTSPMQRMLELQVSAPVELELIGAIRSPPQVEKFIHKALAQHHSRGEWFHSTPDTEFVAGLIRDHDLVQLYSWLQAHLPP